MNQLKSKMIIPIFIGVIVIAGLAFSLAFTSNTSGGSAEQEAIINSIKHAQVLEVNVGAIPTDIIMENHKNGTKTILTEDQAQQIMDAYNQQLTNTFSQKLEKVWVDNEQGIISRFSQYSFDELPGFDVQIDAGCISYELESIKITDDTATVAGNAIAWTKYIERDDESGQYIVILGFSKDNRIDTLVQSNDIWVLDAANGDIEFAPDDYNHEKGRYDTFDEAVAAAAKLDPVTENPFK